MTQLSYTLRPRPVNVLAMLAIGGAFAVILLVALGNAIGAVCAGILATLIAFPVLPYYLWKHPLIVGETHLCMIQGWAWSRRLVRLPYTELRHESGRIPMDTSITFAHGAIFAPGQQHYSINADLLPSQEDFELVVFTLLDRIKQATSPADDQRTDTATDTPSVEGGRRATRPIS